MKRFFQDHPVVLGSLAVGLLTGTVALALEASGALAFVLLLLELVLGICVEILIRVQDLKVHSILSADDLKYLSSDSHAQRLVKAYVTSSRRVHEIGHPLLSAGTRAWDARVQGYLEDHEKGVFSADLAPAPRLLREPLLMGSVKSRVLATSVVNVAEYWDGTWGRNYLKYQGDVVDRLRKGWVPQDGSFGALEESPVTRIFVQPRDRLPELRDVLMEHKRYRLYALVAILEELPDDLCNEDFIVIDDTLTERLELVKGTPTKGTFFVCGGDVDAKIREAVERFTSIRGYAALPETHPEIGLPAITADASPATARGRA